MLGVWMEGVKVFGAVAISRPGDLIDLYSHTTP